MEITWWQCRPCTLTIEGDADCPRCGAKPPTFVVGATLHFTGVRIPKED